MRASLATHPVLFCDLKEVLVSSDLAEHIDVPVSLPPARARQQEQHEAGSDSDEERNEQNSRGDFEEIGHAQTDCDQYDVNNYLEVMLVIV